MGDTSQKRRRSNKRITCEEGVSVEEAQELIHSPAQAIKLRKVAHADDEPSTSQPRTPAPPRCSDCRKYAMS